MSKKPSAQSTTQTTAKKPAKLDKATAYEVRPEQSVDLLKALHILTNDGKINQDSRRKLKQIYHLFVRINRVVYSLFDKSNFVVSRRGLSYLMICEV